MSVDFQLKNNGFAVIRSAFSQEEIEIIKWNISDYLKTDRLGVIYEKDQETVRAIHGLHLYDEFFSLMARDSRLLDVAEQTLGTKCYVHQFKINMKQRLSGQSWPWHQDYIFWNQQDGIPRPALLNAAIFLSDMPMLSGPLCVIPGSHKSGQLSEAVGESRSSWESDVSQDLTYQIRSKNLEGLIARNGVEYITGAAGDLLLFDPMLAHCSSSNLSPNDRELLIITYNSVDNHPPRGQGQARPEFLSARDFSPLCSVESLAFEIA